MLMYTQVLETDIRRQRDDEKKSVATAVEWMMLCCGAVLSSGILWKRVLIISAESLFPATPVLPLVYTTRNKVTKVYIYIIISFVYAGIGRRTIVIYVRVSLFSFFIFYFFFLSKPLTRNRRLPSPSSNINATYARTYVAVRACVQ